MRIYGLFCLLILSLLIVASYAPLPTNAYPQWTIQTISGNAFSPSGIVLDTNNNPHVAYTQWAPGNKSDYETRNGIDSVVYASWDGSAWHNQTVTEGAVYDLALDSHDNPHILYKGNEGLMYASWTGLDWGFQTVDKSGFGGSLALDSLNNPHVAYFVNGNGTSAFFLKYAILNGSYWTAETVDAGSMTYLPSLKLDTKNQPHVMYETQTFLSGGNSSQSLKYATTDGSMWTIRTVGDNIWFRNFFLDSQAYPHFTYSEPGLLYTSWNGSVWRTEKVNVTALSAESYLALDEKDVPHIAFIDSSSTENEKYAVWDGSAWEIQTVDSNAISAGPLVIDGNGNPHILFYKPSTGYPPLVTLVYATTAEASQVPMKPYLAIFLVTIFIVAVTVLLITVLVYRLKKVNRLKEKNK